VYRKCRMFKDKCARSFLRASDSASQILNVIFTIHLLLELLSSWLLLTPCSPSRSFASIDYLASVACSAMALALA
jgi:hypothetical protein